MPFSAKFPDADPQALDLMEQMLQFDPRKRIDVNQALRHPWLAQLYDEAAEPPPPGAWAGLVLLVVQLTPRLPASHAVASMAAAQQDCSLPTLAPWAGPHG